MTVEAFPGGRDTNKKRDAPDPKKNGGAHPGPAAVFFGGPAPLFLFVSRAPRERSLGLYIGLPCLSGVAVSLLVYVYRPERCRVVHILTRS